MKTLKTRTFPRRVNFPSFTFILISLTVSLLMKTIGRRACGMVSCTIRTMRHGNGKRRRLLCWDPQIHRCCWSSVGNTNTSLVDKKNRRWEPPQHWQSQLKLVRRLRCEPPQHRQSGQLKLVRCLQQQQRPHQLLTLAIWRQSTPTSECGSRSTTHITRSWPTGWSSTFRNLSDVGVKKKIWSPSVSWEAQH